MAGNWKMNTGVEEALELARQVQAGLPDRPPAEVVLLPPLISLWPLRQLLRGDDRIGLGAQNCYWERSGAFTGEVSAAMLRSLCDYVLVGHSERRQLFGETDDQVRLKLDAVLASGLRPIVAVGETLDQRQAGRTDDVIGAQARAAFQGLEPDLAARCTVAYEPIWAIGTGRSASPEDAAGAADAIRRVIDSLHPALARQIRVLYGGSVSAESAADLFAPEAVDGGLVGGASLRAGEFLAVVGAAAPV